MLCLFPRTNENCLPVYVRRLEDARAAYLSHVRRNVHVDRIHIVDRFHGWELETSAINLPSVALVLLHLAQKLP